jgi:hypothetical protein
MRKRTILIVVVTNLLVLIITSLAIQFSVIASAIIGNKPFLTARPSLTKSADLVPQPFTAPSTSPSQVVSCFYPMQEGIASICPPPVRPPIKTIIIPPSEANYSANITITSAELTQNSLSITVENTGNLSVVLSFIAITPFPYPITPPPPNRMLPMVLPVSTGIDFLILPNGSLVPSTPVQPCCSQMYSGYQLNPGESVTFTYS